MGSHEPAIQAVQEAGEKLMDVSNLGVPEIEQRLKALNQAWAELKQFAATRGQKLNESLMYQQFLTKVIITTFIKLTVILMAFIIRLKKKKHGSVKNNSFLVWMTMAILWQLYKVF